MLAETRTLKSELAFGFQVFLNLQVVAASGRHKLTCSCYSAQAQNEKATIKLSYFFIIILELNF